VRVHVRSSFTWEPGTWVVSEQELESQGMEQAVISGRHPRHVRGQDHDHERPRPTGRGRAGVPCAGRRSGQRRHDRAERVDRGSHRHLVHRAARRSRADPQGDGEGGGRMSAPPASRTTPASVACRSSARA
jgi:hypothetical protein